MNGLFQGNPLTKTTQEQQTAPEFYTDYLQDIANLGQNAVQQGGVAGFSPLQQQAFNMAKDAAFAGSGSMGAASQLIGQAGTTKLPDIINQYMNPYTTNVVDEMARLSNENVQKNVMPSLNAAAAGSGQFGSTRQANATGQSLRDIQADLTGKQYAALNTGYQNAGTFAQNDLNRTLQSGQAFDKLGTSQQELAKSGLKTMFDYGTQQQNQGQKLLDYPMEQAKKFADLLKNYNIPMGKTSQTIGVEGYTGSPLSQIGGLASIIASIYNKQPTTVPPKANGGSVNMADGGGVRLADGGIAPSGAEYHDGNGNFYDADGYLLE